MNPYCGCPRIDGRTSPLPAAHQCGQNIERIRDIAIRNAPCRMAEQTLSESDAIRQLATLRSSRARCMARRVVKNCALSDAKMRRPSRCRCACEPLNTDHAASRHARCADCRENGERSHHGNAVHRHATSGAAQTFSRRDAISDHWRQKRRRQDHRRIEDDGTGLRTSRFRAAQPRTSCCGSTAGRTPVRHRPRRPWESIRSCCAHRRPGHRPCRSPAR